MSRFDWLTTDPYKIGNFGVFLAIVGTVFGPVIDFIDRIRD